MINIKKCQILGLNQDIVERAISRACNFVFQPGVIVFVGLTAVDAQKLKQLYLETRGSGEWAERIAIIGALTLYLDFINVFLNLSGFFGRRKW